MIINFSRHANRRARLYAIPEQTVIDILQNEKLEPGKHEIIKDVPDFSLPIKIVIVMEDDVLTVVTVYLLKKGRLT
jgi:hypothetical protein